MESCSNCNNTQCLDMVPSQYDAMEFECCVCAQEPMCDNCIDRVAEEAVNRGFQIRLE